MKKSVIAFIIFLLATIQLASGRCPNNEEFRKYCNCSSRIDGLPKKYFVGKYFFEVVCFSLNDTNIETIVELLKNQRVDKLTLEQSNIKTLRYKTFNNTNILRLTIENSSLEFIEKGTIGSIKGLLDLEILQSNLQRFPDISNASKLYSILIQSANISSIGPTDISPSNSLRYLDINYANIVKIKESAFCGLKRLELFNLIGNKITELPKNLTCGQSLREIDISSNELTKIEFETFEKNKHLDYVEFESNRIDSLSYSKFFKYMMLRGTDLNSEGNHLTCNKSLCWLADLIASKEKNYFYLWGKCQYPGVDRYSELRSLNPKDLNC